jgi:hypothetical protein
MGILKIRGLGEATIKSSPAFWEYPPPMGFIYGMAPDKIYHEPNLHRSQGGGVEVQVEISYAYSSIVGGKLCLFT